MARILVAAFDGDGTNGLAGYVKKGDIIELKEDGHVWGTKEALPTHIHVDIADRTAAQVESYLTSVKKLFTYAINTQNVNGIRATISVDQAGSGSVDNEVKQAVKDYILTGGSQNLSVALHSQTSTSLTVNIALPDDGTGTAKLQAFRDDINDKFEEQIGYRRYFFESSAVDSVVAGGGQISVTAAQAAANIVDRFS